MKTYMFIALLGTATVVQASRLDYYPEGAICDRKSGFCADHMGVSVALTKLYLGEKAEKKLMAQIKEVGTENFDATTFSMQGGLTCDAKIKTCWTNRYDKKVDVKATHTLFGK